MMLVVIVGWGIEKQVPNFLGGTDPLDSDWIVRNSWGPQWNKDGYFKYRCIYPNTGIDMAVVLDILLRIGGTNFGAVTTLLPDIPFSSTVRRTSPDFVPRFLY